MESATWDRRERESESYSFLRQTVSFGNVNRKGGGREVEACATILEKLSGATQHLRGRKEKKGSHDKVERMRHLVDIL